MIVVVFHPSQGSFFSTLGDDKVSVFACTNAWGLLTGWLPSIVLTQGACFGFIFKYYRQKWHTPKFESIRVRTHDLQIMHSTFHIAEMLSLTTGPSGTPIHTNTWGRLTGYLKSPGTLPNNPDPVSKPVLFLLLVHVWLGQKYYAPEVRPDLGLNPWPPDHEQYISCHWDAVVLTTEPSGMPIHTNYSRKWSGHLKSPGALPNSPDPVSKVVLFLLLVQVQLRQKCHTPSSSRSGFELMTSRSWTVHFLSLRRRRLNRLTIRDLHCSVSSLQLPGIYNTKPPYLTAAFSFVAWCLI